MQAFQGCLCALFVCTTFDPSGPSALLLTFATLLSHRQISFAVEGPPTHKGSEPVLLQRYIKAIVSTCSTEAPAQACQCIIWKAAGGARCC